MPIVGIQQDRVAEAMEELCEKIDASIAVRSEPPVVHVSAPVINVEAKSPVPVVNVAASKKETQSWTFTVSRDSEGRIQSMTATPKF